MKVELLDITPNAYWLMTQAANMSFGTDHKDYEKIMKEIMARGIWTVLEFADATFKISGISRACSHQLVRHRLLSIVQKSQRYIDESNFEVVVPKDIGDDIDALDEYAHIIRDIADCYMELRELGIKKEDARFVLPNACKTEMVVKANFREWRYIIELRGKKDAQWEIRELVGKIHEILNEKYPVIFGDLEIDK